MPARDLTVARLRENLPQCHVRLSLFNWALIRPRATLDYNNSDTSILFVTSRVGLTRVDRLDFICHSGILPRRETSDGGCLGAFAFSLPPCPAVAADLEEDRCPAFLR